MDLDAIIDDCTISPEAAEALAEAMPRLVPSGGHGDAWASASASGRAIARLLRAGDVIGYETRDALDQQVWDDLASRVSMTDTGSGMEVTPISAPSGGQWDSHPSYTAGKGTRPACGRATTDDLAGPACVLPVGHDGPCCDQDE